MYRFNKEDGTVSYATYFNSLSVEKWKKYTEIDTIQLKLSFVGHCTLTLNNYDIIHTEILGITDLDSDVISSSTIDIPETAAKGIIGFEVSDMSDDFQILGGYYESEIQDEAFSEVRLALDICTFKRESDVTATLKILASEILSNDDSELRDRLQVYVQDNGNTLDISKLESEKVHIVYNKNCGGAGGFTRGLIEIMHHMDAFPATHVIMMDDDIEICTETLYRTYSLLACRKKEYSDLVIGGAMLDLDDPMVQTQSGAAWDSGRIISGKPGIRLDNTTACVINETEELYHYNAWWYCCMPMSFIRPDNLPIPIFVGGDDIEYGLRNIRQLCLLNGICVWHEASENKYSSSRLYYNQRNMLIDNALHCDNFCYGNFAKVLMKRVFKELSMLRYRNADIFIKASEDYLKGIDYLKNTDGERHHSDISKLGYKFSPMEDAAGCDKSKWRKPAEKIQGFKNKAMFVITIGGTLLSARNRSETGILMLHPMDSSAFDVYREKKVLYYDEKNHRGFVVERKRSEAIRLMLQTIGVIIKAFPRYEKVKREYKARIGEVTSEAFWKKYLDME